MQNEELKNQIAAKEQELVAAKEQNAALEGENEQLKTDKAALETTNQQQDAKIKDLESQLADKTQQVCMPNSFVNHMLIVA